MGCRECSPYSPVLFTTTSVNATCQKGHGPHYSGERHESKLKVSKKYFYSMRIPMSLCEHTPNGGKEKHFPFPQVMQQQPNMSTQWHKSVQLLGQLPRQIQDSCRLPRNGTRIQHNSQIRASPPTPLVICCHSARAASQNVHHRALQVPWHKWLEIP